MALLDEGKLQGNIYNILDLLRKETQCCKFIQGSWMCDSGSSTPVWVLINTKGGITTLSSPDGSPVDVVGTLGPLDATGHCPQPVFVPAITNFNVNVDGCFLTSQAIDFSFDTNIPLGAYLLQVFNTGTFLWEDAFAVFARIGPTSWSSGQVALTCSPLLGSAAFRIVEVNTGTIGGPFTANGFVSCIP